MKVKEILEGQAMTNQTPGHRFLSFHHCSASAGIILLTALVGCGGGQPGSSGGKAGQSDAGQEADKLTYDQLKLIGIACHDYHDENNTLPTDNGSKSKLSWRVQILPFVNEKALAKEFKHDEPWDSPHNKNLLDKMPDIYISPHFQNKKDKPTETYYQGFVGNGGVLGEKDGATRTAITNAC